jgi:hypothetical protein
MAAAHLILRPARRWPQAEDGPAGLRFSRSCTPAFARRVPSTVGPFVVHQRRCVLCRTKGNFESSRVPAGGVLHAGGLERGVHRGRRRPRRGPARPAAVR